MKKNISLVLCLIILSACVCMPVAHAEYEQPGASVWFVYPYNGFTAEIGVDGTYKHHGNSSLKIVNTNDSSKSAKIATHSSNWISKSDIGSTYRMSFWVKTENILADSFYYLPSYMDNNTKKAVAAGTNDWTCYTTDFVINQTFMSNGTYLGFEIRNKGTIWIDEVSMQKVNSDGTLGLNTIANPSFEWYGFYFGGDKNDTETAPSWTIFTQRTPDYDMESRVVTNIKRSGEASLKLTNNMGAIAYIYLRLYQNIPNLENGKKYRYSFWVKSENKFAQNMLYRPCVDSGPSPAGFGDNVFGNKDWNLVSRDWTKDSGWGNTNFSIDIGSSGTLWLDDLSVQLVNDDGSLGNNLLENPGFESKVDLIPTGEVTSINVTSAFDNATLSWTNPADPKADADFWGTEIYMVQPSAELKLIASLDKSKTSYKVTNLNGGTTYNILIKALDKSCNSSAGSKVTFETLGMYVNHPVFTQNGLPVSRLASGDIEAKADIQYCLDNPQEVTLIMALYKDNYMISAAATKRSLIKNDTNSVSASLNVGALSDGEYKLYTYVWDDIFKGKLLAGYSVIDKSGINHFD